MRKRMFTGYDRGAGRSWWLFHTNTLSLSHKLPLVTAPNAGDAINLLHKIPFWTLILNLSMFSTNHSIRVFS